MRVVRRRHRDGCAGGRAVALACVLLLVVSACRTHRCAVDPPDRAIHAPAALATELRARLPRASEGAGPLALIVAEDELTALLRQALADTPARDITLHITAEALYLQAAVGERGVPVRAAIVPTIDDGRLALRVPCLTVDDSTWPRAVRAAIESALTALAADAAWSLPVQGVTLEEGTLTLEVERGPAPGA